MASLRALHVARGASSRVSGFRAPTRLTSAGTRFVQQVQQRRNASFYNTDVAGLTEEEAEVRIYLPMLQFYTS